MNSLRMHGKSGTTSAAARQRKRKHKAGPRTIERVIQAFSPYKLQAILVLSAIVVATVLGLVNPFLISFVFDDAIGKGNAKLLLILVAIMCITPIVTNLIGVGQTYLNNLIGQNVMRDLRNKIYRHLATTQDC